jgi:hypothetical protein
MKKFLLSKKTNITCNHFSKRILLVAITACALIPQTLLAQKAQAVADTTKAREYGSPQLVVKPTYPKVVGYLSFILPIVTINNTSTTANFSKGTSNIGFPVGVNVLYSDKFGFSYEFTPNIEATGGTSKVNKILFDPGTMFRFDHGFTIITRLAFDTQGRYGFTPVFNQVYLRTKDVNYFVALSLPARFGNSETASIGLNLQIGFTFN